MEECNIPLFTCLLKGEEIYYKCLVENNNGYEPIYCCGYLRKEIKAIVKLNILVIIMELAPIEI